MKEINSNVRYIFTLFIWAIILASIYSVLFYPINYFILAFSPIYYFCLFAGVFVCSGVLFHRFYLNIFDNVMYAVKIAKEYFNIKVEVKNRAQYLILLWELKNLSMKNGLPTPEELDSFKVINKAIIKSF